MAFVLSDRVKETTTTSGTGTLSLGGAVGGFVSFSSGIGVGNTTYYVIENDAKWEIGIGTVSSGSLSRDTVIASSDGGSSISLSGVSFVFVALPASKTVLNDNLGETTLPGGLSLTTSDALIEADNILIHKHAHINNITSSGDIVSSGMLTLTRTGAGSFFHAYKEGVNPTIALYSDASASPEWKLGLKSNPNSSGDPPTYGYIHGEDGNIGLYANDDNTLTLSHSLGLVVKNKGNTIITSSNDNGAAINGQAASYPVLILKSSSAQAANIQEWHNSAGTALSYIDKSGELFIAENNLLSSINLNSASGAAISGWAADSFGVGSLNMPAASGTHISQNAEDIITVSGIASGVPQNTEDIVTVSGIANAAYTGVGDVSIMQYIYHEGDGDTYIRFRGDQIDFVAGGKTMLTLDETAQDIVKINDGKNDVDFQVEGDGEANLIRTNAADDLVGIGTAHPDSLLSCSGIGSFETIRFSDGTTQITAGGGSDANIQVNSASGVDISGYAEDYTQLLDRIPHASGYHLLSEIRFNSASGATNLDSILATSGYFDEVLGSGYTDGYFLGIIPTAVSGYIDYAIGSGATYTDTSINYISSVLYASGLDIGVSGIQSSGDLVIDGNLTLGSSGIATASGMSIGVSGLRFSDGTTQTTAATGGSARSVAGDTDNAIITWVTSDDTFAAESSLTFDGTTLTSNSGQFGGNVQIDGTANANSLAVSGNASIDGNLTVGSSGIVSSSGVSVGASGLRFSDGTTQTTAPTDTNTTYTAGSGLTLDGLNKFHATFASSGVSTSGVELKPISSDVLHSSGDRLFHEDGMLKFAGHILTSGAATVGEIDHDALTNFVANEHVDHTSVTLTAGDGLTGGGDISSNRTFAVGAGTLIDVQADQVDVDLSEAAAATIAHGDNLIFLDGGATGAASKGSTDDLATLLAGTSSSTGLSSSNSVLTVADLHPVGVDGSANQLLTDDGDGTVTSEANLTFDGELKLINSHTRFSVANDGSVTASGDITTSGIVNASGMSVSGLYLADYVPTSTSNRLYNEGGTLKFDGSAVGGGGGSARSVSGDEDDAIITWKTSDNTFVAESNFTFDGSTLKIITGDTRFSVTNEGYVFASGDVTSSGTVISSGVSTSGVHLPPIAATALHSSGNQLFHEDGMLKFAGHILTSGAATVGEIDHDALTNFVANEHVDHTSVTLTAGDGLTGGGDISSNRTFAVGAGTLIDVQADQVDVDLSEAAAATIAHGDNLIFLDGGATGAASKGSTDDLATLLAGTSSSTGLSSSNSVLTIADLHPVGVDGSANQLLTDDGDGTVTSESKLTFDGSILKVILGDTRFSVTDEGYVFASGDVTSSGTVISSGVSTSGVHLPPIAATTLHSSGNQLFHENGMLKFAGHILTSGAATVGEIDHDALTNFVGNEHIDHTSVTLTAGDGLTGGGTIASNRTFAVGAGTLIDVQADQVDVDLTEAAAATIAHGDQLIFLDGGATGAASKGSTDDLATLLAGTSSSTGLSSSNSVLTIADLHPVGVDGSANQLLTDDGDGTVTSEANLTFDGSLNLINDHTRFSVANDGSVTASGDITTSGIVNASGMSVSGLYLANYVPTSTTNRLYNEGGTLKFNGSAVGGGGGSARSVAGDTDNGLITWVTSDNTFASEANFTYDGTDALIQSSSDGKPVLTLKTTHTTKTSSSELQFLKDASDTEDGEVLGQITFYGEDEGNNNTQFAKIVAEISESDEGDEAGKLSFFVAESDSTNTAVTAGLVLEGEHATDGEIDVTIGAGSASTVTIPGHIDLAGDIDVDGTTNLDAVDIDGNVQIDGTLTVGVNDTGKDVKFFGATDGSYLEWDESEDRLNLVGGAYVNEAVPANDTATTATAAITIDASLGNYHNIIIGSSQVRTININNAKRGQKIILRLTQNASSAKTVTAWVNDGSSDNVYYTGTSSATLRWAGNIKPTMSTSTGHTDVYGFLCTNAAGSAFDAFIIGQDLPD